MFSANEVEIDIVFTPIINSGRGVQVPYIADGTIMYNLGWQRFAPLHRELNIGGMKEAEQAFEKAGLDMEDFKCWNEKWFVEISRNSEGSIRCLQVTPANWMAIKTEMNALARRKGNDKLTDRVNFVFELEFALKSKK